MIRKFVWCSGLTFFVIEGFWLLVPPSVIFFNINNNWKLKNNDEKLKIKYACTFFPMHPY